MTRALLLILTLCWGLPAWAECAARLQVPGSKMITPWLAVELAQGRQLQESIDVRVSNAQGCPPLALGVDVSVPPENPPWLFGDFELMAEVAGIMVEDPQRRALPGCFRPARGR